MNFGEMLSPENGRIQVPKINGKHSKHVQHVSLKAEGEFLSQGNGVAKMIQANIPMYKEVLPSLESWQASKIASWHNLEGHSIQWFCVVCIDRRGKFYSLHKTMLYFPLASKVGLEHKWGYDACWMHGSSLTLSYF